MGTMGTGTSLILIAVGAILAWAVNYTLVGIDIKIVGAILIVVGIVGLLLSLLFWASFAPFGRHDTRERHDGA
jgi:Domain of unknown function (DUF6458)